MSQRKVIRTVAFAILLSMVAMIRGAGQAPVQHPTVNPVQPRRLRVVGYLAEKEPDFLTMLPPYPALDSVSDKTDVTSLRLWQKPEDSARWRLANEDVRMSYDRFAQYLMQSGLSVRIASAWKVVAATFSNF